MELKYYIPIQSTSLPHYFAGGCIYPANYYGNKPKDIQDSFPNVILLTANHGSSQCDCCLEVVLTPDEMEYMVPIGNEYYLIDKILPISRICKILFCNKEQQNKTISLIRQATAFIPDNIVGSVCSFDDKEIITANRPVDFDGIKQEDMAAKIRRFDSFLGALALMKVAKPDGFNVSPNFIDAVAFFNTLIRSQKEKVRPRNSKLDTYFEAPDKYAFSNSITEDVLYAEAKRKGVEIKKNVVTKIIDTEFLEWPVYGYAMLYTYGVADEAKRKKIDDLILNNFQYNVKKNLEESIAFFYGYNRGYTVFNNIYLKEDKSVDVKFKLESQLDYYIIESVFQYVFNGKVVGELPYLDSWCSKQKACSVRAGEYMILDTIIRDKKKVKVFSEEWWKELLSGFLRNNNLKINFLGKEYDLTEDIEFLLLRPLAKIMDKDIREEVADEYASIINNDKAKIEALEKELNDCKALLASLQNESMRQYTPKEGNPTMVAESPAVYLTQAEAAKPVAENSLDVKEIISKYEMLKKKKKSELIDMVKEKYPYKSLKKGFKNDDLILILLDNNKDPESLF